jgi:hypothetical protein
MKRYYIVLVLLVFAAMMVFAQGGSGLNLAAIDKQVIPEDTAVRKGVLNNGLTMMGLTTQAMQLVQGVVFLIFVAIFADRESLSVIK